MKKYIILLICNLLFDFSCIAQGNIELQNNIDKDVPSIILSPSAADQENHKIQINDKQTTSIIDSLIVKCECLELLNKLTNLKMDVKIADLQCSTHIQFLAAMIDLNGKKTKSVKKLVKESIDLYNKIYDQLKTKSSTLQNTIDEFETHTSLSDHDLGNLYSQLFDIALGLNSLKQSISRLENF